jgi:hypothetical protein
LNQWAQFLIDEALIPASQISTDDFAGPLANQTNLAIKGIVGIRAMAEISCLVGDQAKSENLTVSMPHMATSMCSFVCHPYLDPLLNLIHQSLQNIATDYVSKWQNIATSPDGKHLTLSVSSNPGYEG